MNVNPKVIDISHHQGAIASFGPARAAGIIGVIHKGTEGLGTSDSMYAKNRVLAVNAGMLFGAYHFLRPGNVQKQIDFFLAFTRPSADMLLAIDYEDARVQISTPAPVDDLKEALAYLEAKTGRIPVLYCGNVLKEKLGSKIDQELGRYRLWLAQYGSAPKWSPSWKAPFLWQYTGDGAGPSHPAFPAGKVPGIGKGIDIDSYDGPDDELAARWSGGAIRPVPKQPDAPVTPPAPPPVAENPVPALAESEGFIAAIIRAIAAWVASLRKG